MSHSLFAATTALAFFLAPAAALSLSPDDLWRKWETELALSGTRVEIGETAAAPGSIEMKNLVFVTEAQKTGAQERIRIQTALTEMALKSRADGAVEITFPEVVPLQITLAQGTSEVAGARLELRQTGGLILASGPLDAVRYEMSFPQLTVDLEELTDAGAQPRTASATFSLSDLKLDYLLAPQVGENVGASRIEYRLGTGPLSIDLAMQQPAQTQSGGTAEDLTFQARITSLRAEAAGLLVDPVQGSDNPLAALAAGLALSTKTDIEGVDFALSVEKDDLHSSAKGAVGAMRSLFAFDKSKIDYDVGLSAVTLDVDAPATGLAAFSAGFGEAGLSLTMPLAQSDLAQPYRLGVKLSDLTLSDAIWGLLDPSGTLERAPANLALDLSGTGSWHIDLAAPDGLARLTQEGAFPLDVASLDLNQFLLQVVGTRISGSGKLTFDGADRTSWPGFPAPTGKLGFSLVGVNGLLQNLVSMGILPQEQLMAARLGLAMFTRTGPEPEELISDIEFAGTNLLVNGQKLR